MIDLYSSTPQEIASYFSREVNSFCFNSDNIAKSYIKSKQMKDLDLKNRRNNSYGYKFEQNKRTYRTLFQGTPAPIYNIGDQKKSYHPDDAHLYMVSAKKKDGTYALWTCWNAITKSLNYGHYNLTSAKECEKIFEEYYYSKK